MDYAGESSPTVADGVVYVASKENHLYAIDAETGKQIWFYKTDGLLFASPSVTDKDVVIGGDDGDLFALDRENGHCRMEDHTRFRYLLDPGDRRRPGLCHHQEQDNRGGRSREWR